MGLLSFLFGGNKRQERLVQALQNGAQIIDVRTPGEFAQGHAKGSVNIPLNKLPNSMNKIGKKDGPVVLCCRSGARAGNAQSMLQSKGIEAINAGPWQSVAKALKEA
jgi:rhodanese-related sulfurtransferase